MRRTRFSKILALTLVFVMVMSSVASAASTVISNVLTATVTVTVTVDPAIAALKLVNDLNVVVVETDTAFAMQAALVNPVLGLNLTEYDKLTVGGRRQAVADYVSFTKFANDDFENVAAVQTALNLGVQIEMNKMNLLQILNGNTTRTLDDIVEALIKDNEGFLKFSEVSIKSFYGDDFIATVNDQIASFKAYKNLVSNKKIEAAVIFKGNAYSGSYVTVLNYLKTAIEAVAGPVITLQWISGGEILEDNLVISNVVVGGNATISFEASANKDVTNLGYRVSSNNYITIDGITALAHYIYSDKLINGATETKTVNIKFEVAGECRLTVVAVKQGDTEPTVLTNGVASVSTNNGKPRITLGFTLSEEIDLRQDNVGNIIISYGKLEGSNFIETKRSDGTPIVKSKIWSGYLNLGDTGTKYCSGAENNTIYGNVVPANQVIKTVVDPNYDTMGYANDSAWLAAIVAGKVAVQITVIDNEGNKSVTLISAN